MKVAILGNQARATVNFWTPLIGRLVALGHEVLVFVPAPAPGEDPAWEAALTGMGCRLVRYPLDRKGLNPFSDLKSLLALRAIVKRERPDRLFAYTIKPVIYGSLAAALAGVPVRERRHVMITGLGYMFEGGSFFKKLLTRLAAFLYRLALSRVCAVFFQNIDDRELFQKLGILPRGVSVRMTRGTGVDTEFFAEAPLPSGPPGFLFVGRLLEAKGLYELAGAARLVRARHPHAGFSLLGPLEKGRGGIPLGTIRQWEAEGLLTWLGEARDVRPELARNSVVVLPSWREGTPCSLMEAMSMGRAVVAADAPGSREVVRDGVNGFLVPVRDSEALANAMERFIIEPDLAARMGAAGREMAVAEFDARLVAEEIIKAMDIPLEVSA